MTPVEIALDRAENLVKYALDQGHLISVYHYENLSDVPSQNEDQYQSDHDDLKENILAPTIAMSNDLSAIMSKLGSAEVDCLYFYDRDHAFLADIPQVACGLTSRSPDFAL